MAFFSLSLAVILQCVCFRALKGNGHLVLMGHTVFLQRDNMLFLGAIYFYSYITFISTSIYCTNGLEIKQKFKTIISGVCKRKNM